MLEHLKILITVKTYPIPSQKYGELVCTAGVSDDGKFVRLYPINFRDQPFANQYQKYQWIEVDAEKYKKRDVRKESFRPDCDTIRTIGSPIKTAKGSWAAREKIVLPLCSQSMEELWSLQKQDQTSLGIFKPKVVHDLIAEPTERKWKQSFYEELKQARLWDDRSASREPPRKVPYRFRYKFDCDDARCKGHLMMNEDWELGQFYWRMIDSGSTEKHAISQVKDKFLGELCGPSRNTFFYVGTILAHPGSWVVVGVFWPKKSNQLTFW